MNRVVFGNSITLTSTLAQMEDSIHTGIQDRLG